MSKGKASDLAGQQFGDLEVVSRAAGKAPGGGSLWNCLCRRCGRECQILGKRITSGAGAWRQTDCGCKAAEKRITPGKSYGAVVVLRESGERYRTMKKWIVRCSVCGEEKEMLSSSILRNPKSCGCLPVSPTAMKKAADTSIRHNVRQGVEGEHGNIQVFVTTKESPNAGNESGYRWVRVVRRKGREWIYAKFQIGGIQYYRAGFASREAAHDWAKSVHAAVLDEFGIENPRNAKWIIEAPNGDIYRVNNLRKFVYENPKMFPRPQSFLCNISKWRRSHGWKIRKKTKRHTIYRTRRNSVSGFSGVQRGPGGSCEKGKGKSIFR